MIISAVCVNRNKKQHNCRRHQTCCEQSVRRFVLKKFERYRNEVDSYHDKVVTEHQWERTIYTMMIAQIMDLRNITSKQRKNSSKYKNWSEREIPYIKETGHTDDPFTEGDDRDQLKAFDKMRKTDN